MDIKAAITKAVEKITKDDALRAQFQKEPVKALEKVLGVDLPDEMLEKIVDGVKAKLAANKLGDAVDKLKNLF